MVVSKEEFGWLINSNENKTSLNMSLKKAIVLSGYYVNDLTIPLASYVKIIGNTTFELNTKFIIGKGSIIEFIDDSRLEVKGAFESQGTVSELISFINNKKNNNELPPISWTHQKELY